VAQAELFGIFAREGVDLAARWVAPATNSNAERHSHFSSTTTVPVRAWRCALGDANVDRSAYAFRDYDAKTSSC
jgi:hypothetical protein